MDGKAITKVLVAGALGFAAYKLLLDDSHVHAEVRAIYSTSGTLLNPQDGHGTASFSGNVTNSGTGASKPLLIRVYGRIGGNAVQPVLGRLNPIEVNIGSVPAGSSAPFSSSLTFLDSDPDGPITLRFLLVESGSTVLKQIDSPTIGSSGHAAVDFVVNFTVA